MLHLGTADLQLNYLTQVPSVRFAKNLESYWLNSNKITMIRPGERMPMCGAKQ